MPIGGRSVYWIIELTSKYLKIESTFRQAHLYKDKSMIELDKNQELSVQHTWFSGNNEQTTNKFNKRWDNLFFAMQTYFKYHFFFSKRKVLIFNFMTYSPTHWYSIWKRMPMYRLEQPDTFLRRNKNMKHEHEFSNQIDEMKLKLIQIQQNHSEIVCLF